MLLPAPSIDDRTADKIIEEIRTLSPFYAAEWNAQAAEGAGFALSRDFAQLLFDIIQHLNLTPGKNFVEFLDRLGIKLKGPRSARVPVTFLLAPGTSANVLISERTQVAADATEMRPEVVFETEKNLSATPAVLQGVYSVYPAEDTIYEHLSELPSPASPELFAGENLQEHVLYLGHKDLLRIKGIAKLSLEITPPDPTVTRTLGDTNLVTWEYSLGIDQEMKQELWYPFSGVSVQDNTLVLKKGVPNKINTVSINRLENRWIRCKAKGALQKTSLLGQVSIKNVSLSVSSPFIGWIQKPKGVPIDVPTTAAFVYKDKICLFVLNKAPRIWTSSSIDGMNWSEWIEVPGIEPGSRPAPVVFENRLFLFVRKGSSVYLSSTTDGRTWEQWDEFRYPSMDLCDEPSAVVYGDKIYLFVSGGETRRICRNSSPDGATWNGWIKVPGEVIPSSGPTAVVFEARIYLFVVGTENNEYKIYVNCMDVNENWTGWVKVKDVASDSELAATVFNDHIYLFVSSRSQGTVEISRFGADGKWSGWCDVPWKSILKYSPWATVFNNEGYLVMGGEGDRIWIIPFTLSIVDLAFQNEVSVDLKKPFYPFGTQPRLYDTFYIASSDAFSKSDSVITLTFCIKYGETDTIDLTQNPPVVGWEYWNGTGWVSLRLTTDELGDFLTSKTPSTKQLIFTCPNDLTETSVNGQENHWIRVRIVGGSYGTFKVDGEVKPNFKFPIVNSLTIEYESRSEALEKCITYNNLRYEDHNRYFQTPGLLFQPFQPPEEDKPTFYLGFDKPLVKGPIGMFFSLVKQEYLPETKPRFQWQYWNGKTWARLEVLDDTDNLTRSGLLELAGPADLAAREKFATHLFWIRAEDVEKRFELPRAVEEKLPAFSRALIAYLRISRAFHLARMAKLFGMTLSGIPATFRGPQLSNFSGEYGSLPASERPSAPIRANPAKASLPLARGSEKPCPEVLELFHPSFSVPGEIKKFPPPPILRGIFLNTTWALHAETVRDEILGSSNGRAGQKFTLMRNPIVSEEIWVNEINALMEEERKKLSEQDPDQIRVETDEEGKLTEVWVRWRSVEDLLVSKSTARHCVIDRVFGTVQFGDGTRGMIPPIGIDNIRANYQFGGGSQGNVKAGEVVTLKTSVAGVDKVVNHEAAAGGTDTEALSRALERGPQVIKHRRRAMAQEDFEWLVREAFTSIAKVKCLPTTNQAGEFETGWVAVIIVPQSQEDQPLPSAELIRQVKRYLEECCPNVVSCAEKLIVTGPAFVEVSVTADVFATSIDLIPQVQSETIKNLKKFLHPLTGGPEGEGWEFGTMVCLSDIIAMIEALPNVDHVDNVTMSLRDTLTDATRTITSEILLSAALPPYAMIFSGEHHIAVRFR